MKIKEDEFRLKKLKVLPSGGLQILWKHQWFAEEQMFVTEYSIKQEVVAHPDLTQLLAGLNQYIATVFGYDVLEDEAFNELSAMMACTGLAIAGTDELTTAILIGQKSAGSFNVNLITHPILLQGEQYKFESELEDLVEQISGEVYKYLFEHKYAQTKLLFETEV